MIVAPAKVGESEVPTPCKLPAPLRVAILPEKEELAVTRFVVLVEKEPLSVCRLSTLVASVVTRDARLLLVKLLLPDKLPTVALFI